MTLTYRRTTTLAVAAAAAAAIATPALAAPHLAPTSLNLRASKTVVKAHHSTTFTATLSSHGKGVSGQQIVVQERTAPTTGHKRAWTDQVVTVTDNGNGTYTFTVTPPIASAKNSQKDQYRAVFEKTATYSGSRSEVITVTVKRTHS